MYLKIDELMNGNLKEKPDVLDYITVYRDNIEIRVYGVLHALSGGTNQEYRDFVNKTIQEEKEKNIKVLAEKMMKKMYSGIDVEVEDWLQVSTRDAALIGLKTILPHNFIKLAFLLIKEKITKKDPFNILNPQIKDIGGSPYFHKISPTERRWLAGFSEPKEYLRKNIERKKNPWKYKGPVFPASGWSWLTVVEPFVNIPLRSIHMIEYSLKYAKKNNLTKVALFVGEIHNSDIQWYINEYKENDFTEYENMQIKIAREKAGMPFTQNIYWRKIKYLCAAMSTVTIMIWLYLLIIHWVFKCF